MKPAMVDTRSFFARESGLGGTKINLWLGVAMVALGSITLFVNANGTGGAGIGAGILFILAARWSQTHPLVQFHEDHLELKLAIAAPRQLVLYRDIQGVIEDSPKKAFLLTAQGKKLRLPVAILQEHDRVGLLAALREHERRNRQ